MFNILAYLANLGIFSLFLSREQFNGEREGGKQEKTKPTSSPIGESWTFGCPDKVESSSSTQELKK